MYFIMVGTSMLNRCPPIMSCGTETAYWTNDMMPTAIGIPSHINVYGSVDLGTGELCKSYIVPAEVVRCSLDTDFDLVYKISNYTYDGKGCSAAFCGMKY